jgi:hypothetical protein
MAVTVRVRITCVGLTDFGCVMVEERDAVRRMVRVAVERNEIESVSTRVFVSDTLNRDLESVNPRPDGDGFDVGDMGWTVAVARRENEFETEALAGESVNVTVCDITIVMDADELTG